MKRSFSILLVMTLALSLLMPTVVLAGEATDNCALCGGDRICDTCGGAGYSLMPLYESDELIQIACAAGCNVGACPRCAVLCETCGNDGLCDTCGGLGYETAQAFGSDELLKIACSGVNCRQGFCADCMPEGEDRFALVNAAQPEATPEVMPEPTSEPTPAPTPAPTEKPEPTRTPKPTPTLVPSGQAVFEDGTVIANMELFSDGQFCYACEPMLSSGANDPHLFYFEPTPAFDGSLVSFAEEYVDALVNSGYYTLVETKSGKSHDTWYLRFVYNSRIAYCDNVSLRECDIVVDANAISGAIGLRINPAITVYQ